MVLLEANPRDRQLTSRQAAHSLTGRPVRDKGFLAPEPEPSYRLCFGRCLSLPAGRTATVKPEVPLMVSQGAGVPPASGEGSLLPSNLTPKLSLLVCPTPLDPLALPGPVGNPIPQTRFSSSFRAPWPQ